MPIPNLPVPVRPASRAHAAPEDDVAAAQRALRSAGAMFHFAVTTGLVDLARTLVKKGVPVDYIHPEHSAPPIFRAAARCNIAMVEALRALGADVSGCSSGGHTLLTHCIVAIADRDNETNPISRACNLAVNHAGPRMVQHLLEVVGIDPDQPNLLGETAHALAMEMPEVSQVLHAFRARRAMAAALGAADKGAARPGLPTARTESP